MPRIDLTPQVAEGPYPGTVAADDLDITFTAGDAVNGNAFAFTGRELILVRNTGAGAATFTFDSVPDSFGREGDIAAYSLGAGEFAAFAATKLPGWRQSDGKFHLDVSSADIAFAILRLPA